MNDTITTLTPNMIHEVVEAAESVGATIATSNAGTLEVTFPAPGALRRYAQFILAVEDCSMDWDLGSLFATCTTLICHDQFGLEVEFDRIAGFGDEPAEG